MPVTVASKPSEAAKRISSEEPKKIESLNSLNTEKKTKCGDAAYPPPPGDGEAPVKKNPQKKKAGEERKNGSGVTDKFPKTKAQRAKGSTSLNKTIDKTVDASDKTKQNNTRSNDGLPKDGTEGRKTPVTTRNKIKPKPEDDSKNGKKRKPWVAPVEQESQDTMNEKTVEVVEEVPNEEVDSEIRMTPASNTCSFFEKLQQGVKAYFTSRNSFNPLATDDKNKKKVTEGGIRTRARIAKEVKEDPKKRKPGKIVKAKKYKSNSGLRDDRFRVLSSTGGKSNNSLSDKPKNFRHFQTLIRKKLYRPTKHCVRIQIPRKGYFYRSTVRFKAPGSAPSLQRMESHMPKSKSKVQIPGVAPTSSKSPNLLKKGLKKMRKNAQAVGSQANLPKLSSPAYEEHLNFSLKDKVCDHEKKVSECVATKSLDYRSFSSDEGKSSGKVSSKQKKARQTDAILENSVNCSSPKTKNQVKKKSKGSKKSNLSKGTEDVLEVLETTSERVILNCKSEIRTPQTSETSFNTLLTCISKILSKDEGFCDLEITPIRTSGGEFPVEDDSQSDPSAPQIHPITEVVTVFDSTIDSPEESVPFSPMLQIPCKYQNNGDFELPSEDNIVNLLIGEIDLHLELENYLHTIDNVTNTKSRTRNSLQSNFHDLPTSADVHSLTDEFFDVAETKSNSTFASATSVCAQQDENTNKFNKSLDRKRDMAFFPEEFFDSRNPKTFISQTQFTNKAGDIRKIKSDNDSKKIHQECKLRNTIKRSLGKTSFHSLRLENENSRKLESKLSTDGSDDSYEKIQPLGLYANKSCDEVKALNNLLRINSEYSLSAESFSLNFKKMSSDTDECHYGKGPTDGSKTDEQGTPQMFEKTFSNLSMTPEAPPQLKGKAWRWSPTLQELIEIYNGVLKQNKKFKSNSKNSVSRCDSSHLFSFLNEQLKEKEYKAKLVMLSKVLKQRVKTPQTWIPGRNKRDNSLEEYVAIFQEILHSSLSISQITRLNKVISDLQEYTDKNFDFVKNLKQMRKKEEKIKKTEVKKARVSNKMEIKSQSIRLAPKKSKKRNAIKEAAKPVRPPHEKSEVKQERAQNEKRKAQKSAPIKPTKEEKEITKIELPSPTALESILQSSFKADGIDNKNISKNLSDKILVTVELHGNQVLVNRLSYFKNEDALTSVKTKKNGTSELIIENVTKNQVNDEQKKQNGGKSNRLEDLNNVRSPSKRKSEEKVKSTKKPEKVKNHSLIAMGSASAAKKEKETFFEKGDSSFGMEKNQDCKSPVQFEYDQILLRAQHPIEAIVESSESKISGDVDSSIDSFDDDRSSVKPLPDKVIFRTNIHSRPLFPKPLQKKKGSSEKVFSKDLVCDFGWSGDELNKSFSQMKSSYLINQKAVKRRPFIKKKAKDTKKVRSLFDLKSNHRCRRKGRRQINSYICFPTIPHSGKVSVCKNKSTRQIKQDSRTFHPTSNCGFRAQTDEVTKKCSKELGSKNLKSEIGTFLNLKQDNFDKEIDDMSVFVNKEIVLECYSSELLYDNENLCSTITPKPSFLAMKHYSKASLENVSAPVEVNGPIPSNESAITVKDVKKSPIMILPSKEICESLSNSSITIHSDSFLKCFPLTFIHDNYYFLFKSNSDVKFYPGRACGDEKEISPFVKFVLTPSQNAEAELPPEQVEVKDKRHAVKSVIDDSSKEEMARSASENTDQKVSLLSIEKFIRKLSKNNKKEKSKLKKKVKSEFEGNPMATIAGKPCQKNKTPVPGQKSRLKGTDRKPYHECQMRKLADKEKRSETKPKAKESKPKTKENKQIPKNINLRTTESKANLNKENAAHKDTKTKAAETNLIFFNNFVSAFSKIMDIYENHSKGKVENHLFNKCEKESDWLLTKTYCDNDLFGMKVEKHLEKGTNTIPEKKCSLTGVLDSSMEEPQRLRSAITQTDDFLNAHDEIVTESENHYVEQPTTTCENLNCISKSSSETTLPRMLKIKILCKNHKKNIKALKTGNDPELSALEKELPQQNIKEIQPSDTVTEEPEVEIIKRRNSTYFDATDHQSDEESHHRQAGERLYKKQKEFVTNWSKADIGSLSNWVNVKKESDRILLPRRILLYNTSLEERSLELMLDEIQKSLQNNNICYSLELLNEVLLKAESSLSWSRNSDKLRKTLFTVNDKSKDLIIHLEKNAWPKVLSLIEDACQMLKIEGVNWECSKKTFIEKIPGRKDRRLVYLKKICSFLSQVTTEGNSRIRHVIDKITDFLRHLKTGITIKWSRSLKLWSCEERTKRHSVHCNKHVPFFIYIDFKRPPYEHTNPFLRLRKQIQERKNYIEFLMSACRKFAPAEIQDAKKKAIETMMFFERVMDETVP